ncbi:MAG TPA: TetR/AcrR family transcriptional regulator [Gemmataceae bacterium]|jgi:AcrR family transcriptional regulator|nr:TetR/AcrR family transcriptional regulator [Gemmataceae bacterium]
MPKSTTQRRRAEVPKMRKARERMRKADRKRQLLAHAKQLFVTLGYQDTTTEKIARAAGVSEPVLYRHFESKKALFLEVLHEVREATLTRWHAHAAGLSDPMAKLHAIADMYLGTTREHALEFRVMHRTLIETDDEEIAAFLRSFYLDSETLLAQIIGEGQQTGVFRRSLDPRVGAWELIRTALGYTLTLPLGIPLYEEPDYLGKAIECLLHCLLKTDV